MIVLYSSKKNRITLRRSFLQRTSSLPSTSGHAFGGTKSSGPPSAPQPYWGTRVRTSPLFLLASYQEQTAVAAHDTLPATPQSVFARTRAFGRALARGRRPHNPFLANSRGVGSDSVRSCPAALDLRALTWPPLACPCPSHQMPGLPLRRTGHLYF